MGNIVLMNILSCQNCNKTLAKIDIEKGIIQIKCGKCGTINTLDKKEKVQSAKSISIQR